MHTTALRAPRSIIFLELRRTCLLWSVTEAVATRLETLTRGRPGINLSTYYVFLCVKAKVLGQRQDAVDAGKIPACNSCLLRRRKNSSQAGFIFIKKKDLLSWTTFKSPSLFSCSVHQLMQCHTLQSSMHNPRRVQGLNFQAASVPSQRSTLRLYPLSCRVCQSPSLPNLGCPGNKSLTLLSQGV